MFYCGIDIAKYKHEASVIDATGVALLDTINPFVPGENTISPPLALFHVNSAISSSRS